MGARAARVCVCVSDVVCTTYFIQFQIARSHELGIAVMCACVNTQCAPFYRRTRSTRTPATGTGPAERHINSNTPRIFRTVYTHTHTASHQPLTWLLRCANAYITYSSGTTHTHTHIQMVGGLIFNVILFTCYVAIMRTRT